MTAVSARRDRGLNAPAQFEGFDMDKLKLTTLEPDDIAEIFWDLSLKRDRMGEVVGTGL